MNKKTFLKKFIYIFLGIIVFLLILGVKSNAASLSISTSKSSVSPGGTFTVTVKVSNGAGKVTASVSNGSGGKTAFLDNSSFSFTCTAGNSGSVTVKASGSIADYTTEKESNKSASKTVKIVKKSSNSGSSSNRQPQTTQKSSDATLKELTIKEGTITPEFKADVKEYQVSVTNEITQINVTATPTDSKATVKVEGNKDLKEGENPVTVTVTAEDGTTAKYTINVTRERAKLSLQTLVIKYQNQNGEQIEIPLNPVFNFETTEYTLQDLEYWVEKLDIEAKANLEGATINIEGSENLQIGENTITITVKMPAEVQENAKETEEAPKEETIIYTIKVIKKEEPTLIAKISDWFKGIFGGITAWYNNNTPKIILGALGVCIIALLGLSIYIVIDYNKYKDIIKNVKKVSQINTTEVETENILEQIHSNINKDNENIETKTDNNIVKPKGGKHF